jgi:hypothetical protein
MDNERKGFVFYRSFYEAITDKDVGLTKTEQLDLFLAISEYCLFGVVPELTGRSKAMWILIKPQLDANNNRYENGTKGGAPKGNQNAKKTTEKQPKTTEKQPKTTKNNQKQPKEKEKEKDKEKEKGKIQPVVESMPDYIRERVEKIKEA